MWLDRKHIEPVMQKILRAPDAELVSYERTPIVYVNLGEDSRALFRVDGVGSVDAETRDWSYILKVFRPLADGSTLDPETPHYWCREVLAYTSGLLDSLPDGLRIPQCYRAEQMEDGSYCLSMENMTLSLQPPWPFSRFRLAAYHLGLFNGRYLDREAWEQYAWLSRAMTRIWSEENAYTIDLLEREGVWENPALKAAFPIPLSEPLLKLWRDRMACYETLSRLPQTLCHHDAGHRNLFDNLDAGGKRQTVLIDWELVGWGALGEELGNLFATALINFEVSVGEAEALAQTVLQGYLEGLQAAGWQGEAEHVRLGFLLAVLFRWLFPAAGWPIAIATDDSGRAEQQTLHQWGRPMQEVYCQWAGTAYYLCGRIEEAMELMRRFNKDVSHSL